MEASSKKRRPPNEPKLTGWLDGLNRALYGGSPSNGLQRTRGHDSLTPRIRLLVSSASLPRAGPSEGYGSRPTLHRDTEPRWETCRRLARRARMEPGAPGFGESTAALDQGARSKVAMRRTHLGRSRFRLRPGFALGPVTTSSGHAPVGNFNLPFGV